MMYIINVEKVDMCSVMFTCNTKRMVVTVENAFKIPLGVYEVDSDYKVTEYMFQMDVKKFFMKMKVVEVEEVKPIKRESWFSFSR